MPTPSKLPSTLANAEFNAFAEAISPEPLGDRKPEVGELLYCPASNNIFRFEGQSGGVKTGTVIFNMNKTSVARKSKVRIALSRCHRAIIIQ